MVKPKILKYKPASATITRMDISATHYRQTPFESDRFYASLANKLYPAINDMFKQNSGLTPEVSKRAAIMLACYVEDLVSGSCIWSAFTSLHEKKYGRKLPFYNLDNSGIPIPYDDELPSMHAVQFILWYVINGVKTDTVVNPLNPAIGMLAMQLTSILLDAYEEAPDSPVRPMIVSEEEIGIPVFFQIRDICSWLCSGCYLTRVSDNTAMTREFSKFIKQTTAKCNGDVGQAEYAMESFVPFNALIGPLGIPAYEWLAEIVSLNPEDGEDKYIPLLREMKSLPYEFYKYKSVDGDRAVVVNVEGEELPMSAITMPHERFADDIKAGVSSMMSLVYFDGIWVMNSLCMQPLPAEVYDEAYEKYINKSKDNKATYKEILKRLKNKRIGVCANYDEYMSKVYDGDDWREKTDREMYSELNDVDNLLYFVNTDSTVSMLPDRGGSIKLRGNKFYDKQEAHNDAITFIFDHSLSTAEFREYIIENNLIPDAALSSVVSKEAGRRLFQENIRFFNDYTARNTLHFLSQKVSTTA